MKRTLLFVLFLIVLIFFSWSGCLSTYALRSELSTATRPVTQVTTGYWNAHPYDLVYTVAFSRAEQPNGPLVTYRVSATDLRNSLPVFAIQRDQNPAPLTPLLFPSPDGRRVALLTPLSGSYASSLHGAALRILATDGSSTAAERGVASIKNAALFLVPSGVAAGDSLIWSADSQALYYHTGREAIVQSSTANVKGTQQQSGAAPEGTNGGATDYDEIHRVDLQGHDVTLLHWRQADTGGSLRLIGLDHSGTLVMTLARLHLPVAVLQLNTSENAGQGTFHSFVQRTPNAVLNLPDDILPGNVLRVSSDGTSLECERVLNWQPLHYSMIRISLANGLVTQSKPLFDTARFGPELSALSLSSDGKVLVMSQTLSVRQDLALQGIANVSAQEVLLLAEPSTGAIQRLTLPFGAQLVQVFWTAHLSLDQIHTVTQNTVAALLAVHKPIGGAGSNNASPFQQDEWMLEGHAGKLLDSPALPTMCYGTCLQGLTGPPHMSAAILHGIAYVESDWHQFNAADFNLNGEPIGSPLESADGGWGEFQQTWGMPPQCVAQGNCRNDASRIQFEQSYNIGTGIRGLIHAWNVTAGVASKNDPNNPYKANHWFFAVWAYNGIYGNNPNDVPSSQYGQWYTGAPFHSIYQEYVWYFAAHPQNLSSGWTDNYLPSLGSALLPPQSNFLNTSDSFVVCVTCSIPDWTAGSYDRDWVGVGAPQTAMATSYKAMFAQLGGEDVVGLPRDNGSGAAMHRWYTGWIQDFGGGSALPGALLLADGTTTPYWVYGTVWNQYLTVDHGAKGCHSYPTSQLSPYPNPGPSKDVLFRQTFQKGAIIWDATTNTVRSDVCA